MTIDFSKIFDFLNSLNGMPKFGLVFIFCLALGFGLKKAPGVENSHIPSYVMLAGALLLPMLSDWPSSSLHSVRVFILTQVLIGFITGAVATMSYRVIIKPLLLKLGAKPEDIDTDPPFPTPEDYQKRQQDLEKEKGEKGK